MGNFAIGGLVSGLDPKALVTQLMSVERLAGNKIVSAKTSANALQGALTKLNGLVKTMGDAASAVVPDPIAKTSIWNSSTAKSSNTDVAKVTASSVPGGGLLSFSVVQVAKAGAAMTGEIKVADRNTAISAAPWSLTINNHGKDVKVDFTAADTLNTVVDKLNANKDVDVAATVVKVSDGTYRLQMNSKTTGADTTLAFSGDTSVLGGFNTLQAGQDTKVTVGADSPAEFSVTSTTTKVEGLMEGVTIDVVAPNKSTTDPGTGKTTWEQVTVTSAKDPSAMADKIQAMVDAANAALANIRINSKVDPNLAKAAPSKPTENNSGVFLGNSTTRDVTSRISDVFVGSSANLPSIAGISIDKAGAVTFDRAKFTEAYGKDPAAVEKTVVATAQKLADVSKSLTDSTDGTLTAAIKGQDNLIKDYSDRVKRFEARMTAKEEILTRQFTALDSMLTKMKTQGDWLAGQLAALPQPGKN